MNMKRIISMIKTEYEKALSQNRKTKKFSASQGAGKLLILFFITMLVFTIVSRAASSITVAKVTISNPQRDRLAYSISGTGEIVPEAEKRLMVLPGYRVDEVYVKTGEEVEVGTVLYSYSMESLQDKYTSAENEIKKLELLMDEERLKQQPSDQASRTAALSLKQAKENLEVAKLKLEKELKDYEDSKSSTLEKLLENKNKEYDAALKSYSDLLTSQAKQRILSERQVKDAKTALEQAGGIKTKIKQFISNYKDAFYSKDRLAMYLAQEDLFEAYYGSAKAYEEHKDAVYAKALAAMGEGTNLWDLQNYIKYYEEYLNRYLDELEKLDSDQSKKELREKYNDKLNSYFNYLDEYERQINIMEGAYQEESGELRKIRRNDNRIKDYLIELNKSIVEGTDTEAPEKKLFDVIYGDRKEETEEEIEKKTLALTRAEEDYELQEKEFERERNRLQSEKNELKKVIKSIEDGTYDYEEAIEGKRQEVEAAEEAVRLANQAVEMNNLENAASGDQNKQISELVLKSYRIDLDAKKQELDKIKKLMDASGEVMSSEKGIVTFVGVESGKMTTGDEMIRLGFGDYLFRAEFDREAATNIEEGVTAYIRLAGKKRNVEVEIEKITMTEKGISELTARMPEDKYLLGEKAEFKVTTESEQFDQCIPIQALREDNFGDYILVTKEQEDILGTLLVAERVNVTILDKGSRIVAIDGPVSSKSQVITDSNKVVNVGDRIRIDY
jgi:multidrug resistance efflux pump